MSQHDLTIANQTAANARADINNALQALGSTLSGSTEPSDPSIGMLWYDTNNNLLKLRSEANDNWIPIGYFDQGNLSFRILDNTQVTNTSGVQTGLLGDQSTSVWQAGTGTTPSLVSPANVKSAVEALVPDTIGVNQTWQNLGGSRSGNTAYRNTTSRPIQVAITASTQGRVEVSTNGSTWVIIQHEMGIVGESRNTIAFIVPVNHYYKITSTFEQWAELR
tara:strand:- start:47 stop:709 length:663 start_codon:yes stop_codon:yes gene_type:complete